MSPPISHWCERIKAIAAQKDCTPGQLVLAWLLAQGDDIVPIPGTKHTARLNENIGALAVQLSAADLAADRTSGFRSARSPACAIPKAQMKSVYV